jgi:hypothetical protein
MFYLKLKLDAVFGHVHSSTDVCCYVEGGGLCYFSFVVMQIIYTNLVVISCTSHCYPRLWWKLRCFRNVGLNVAPCFMFPTEHLLS